VADQAGENQYEADREPGPRVQVVTALLNPRDEEAEAAEMVEPASIAPNDVTKRDATMTAAAPWPSG
jgi:hypothetical protein